MSWITTSVSHPPAPPRRRCPPGPAAPPRAAAASPSGPSSFLYQRAASHRDRPREGPIRDRLSITSSYAAERAGPATPATAEPTGGASRSARLPTCPPRRFSFPEVCRLCSGACPARHHPRQVGLLSPEGLRYAPFPLPPPGAGSPIPPAGMPFLHRPAACLSPARCAELPFPPPIPGQQGFPPIPPPFANGPPGQGGAPGGGEKR